MVQCSRYRRLCLDRPIGKARLQLPVVAKILLECDPIYNFSSILRLFLAVLTSIQRMSDEYGEAAAYFFTGHHS